MFYSTPLLTTAEFTLMKMMYYIATLFPLIMEKEAKNLDTWFRIAHTTFTDREVLKSGWDEIDGNKMTEVKVQLRYKF